MAPTKILILGGSSFMGLSLISELMEWSKTIQAGSTLPSLEITIINRHKVYWSGELTKMISEFEKNHSVQIYLEKADRKNIEVYSSLVTKTILTKKIDVIVDFCCFQPSDIDPILAGLQEASPLEWAPLYLFISSDSVYEVCPVRRAPSEYSSKLIGEEESLRPVHTKEREKLNSLDEYGDGKLKVEESLYALRKELGAKMAFQFVCLRLPDVVGEFDNSDRLFVYIEWILSGKPIHLQKGHEGTREFSLVHSYKVSQTIIKLIKLHVWDKKSIADWSTEAKFPCSINLVSFRVSLEELLKSVYSVLKALNDSLPALSLTFLSNPLKGSYLYPSVDSGNVSEDKFIQIFGEFQESEVIKKIVQWYMVRRETMEEEIRDIKDEVKEVWVEENKTN